MYNAIARVLEENVVYDDDVKRAWLGYQGLGLLYDAKQVGQQQLCGC